MSLQQSLQNLEQMSDAEFWNFARARASAASRVPSHEEIHLHQYLDCELSRGNCLVALKAIEEVIPPPHRFALLPRIPRWMPGVVAWRSAMIAVVNLDMYLYGIHTLSPEGMLLIAKDADLVVGLLVPALGLTTTIQFEQMAPATGLSMLYTPIRAGVVKGVYAEAPILDVPALLSDVVQQIGMATYHA